KLVIRFGLTEREPVFDCKILSLDVAKIAEPGAQRLNQVGETGRREIAKTHHALLRPRPERPRDRRAAKRGYEFSPSDVDCHVTLPWGACPCNGRTVSHEGIFAGSSFLGKITTVSTRRHSLHHQIRQLRHHPQWRLAAGDALHVIVGVAQACDLIVPGGAGEMRGQYYILECQQRIGWWRWLLVGHVQPGAKQLIVCEGAGECGLVDHGAAAGSSC